MAILNNLLVKSSSRFIGTSYFQDVSISGTATLSSLSLSGDLSVTGTSTLAGHVSIGGYNNASYGLSASSAIINSWIRTTGSTGWYNESHGGGWYMTDNNYVRSYGKPVMMGHNLYFNSTSYYVNTSGAASFSSIASPSATISNATISGDLTVNGVLQANDFIKNIVKAVGGQLYVSPTFQATDSTTVTCTNADASYVYLTLQDNGITSSDYAGATWYSGSKIMLSGTLTANTTGHTEEIIFSSAPGELTAQMNGGTNGAKKLQIKVEHDNASTYFKAGNLTFSDVAVMMYQLKNGSNYFPIGIYIKAYGTDNQKSYIDIFGGSDTTPNARLGLLTGLGSMPSGSTIQDWGIYTDNGFFKGIIEANGGLIGNWTIGTTGMYYNSDAPSSTSITMIPGGTAASTTSIGGSSGSKQWIFTGKNLFGIDTTGKLYASSAVISGDITANTGYIGGTSGWTIASQTISNGDVGSNNSMYLSTKNLDSNVSVGGLNTSEWRLTVGSHFGVTGDGKLYCNSTKISGDITATSGTIGGVTANSSYGLYTNSKTSATSTNTGFLISKNGAIYLGAYNSTNGACPFQVTSNGVLTATGATINGTLTAGANSKIGPWHVTTTSIYKSNATMGASTSGAAYFGNDGLSVTDKFKVTSAGVLTATGVDLSGKITANTGYIGGTSGWTIASQQLSSGTLGADNSLYLGTKNLGSNTSIAGRQGSDWRLTVGSHFGVTGDGTIYANSAIISGTLTAGASSTIGPWHVTATSIYKGANTLGSTTSGAAYFGNDGLSVGNKFKVDASGNGSIILGELSEGQTHIEVDSDSFDVCSGATTGDNAVKLATFGEITRIGSGGSNVFIDGSGFSFTNTDGDEMMKINVDNVVIGKEGSSYFYVDSNSIILKDNENADVFKVESGGGITKSTTFNDDHYDKFSNTQISGGYIKTHSDNGAKSSVNKITVKFYKTYTETIVINGQNVTREFLKFNNAIILNTKYYTTSFVENSNVKVTLTSGSGGGVQYINNLLLIYCDSKHPRFDIVWTYSHKTETYSNLNMDGNMNVTGVISAENKIQSDEIFANNITADNFTFWANGININETWSNTKNVTITANNKIDQKPAIGAQLTLYSGIYLLVANGDFNSGVTSGNRVVQLAIYEGINPVNSNVLTRTRVRVVNAAAYWSGLTTHAIVTVPFNTGQTFTVGLTSSIAQSSTSSTSIQAIYLRPPETE